MGGGSKTAYAILSGMHRGRSRSGGYTVIETMIFLAVSGALFLSAMILVNGQQRKAEFYQGVNEVAAMLQDASNDVATGYASFPFASGSCWTNGSTIQVQATQPGGYHRCIYIGKVLQFSPGGATDRYRLYSIVGRQYQPSGLEVTSLATAQPLALAPGSAVNASGPNYSKEVPLGNGLTIGWVRYNTTVNVGSFGFFSTFAVYGSNGMVASNSTVSNTVPVVSSSLGESTTSLVDRVHNPANLSVVNPSVTVCLNSGGTNQRARLTFGGTGNGASTVSKTIENGAC